MDKDGYAVRAELGRRTGRTSMPSTWLGPETLLGGCNDGGLGAESHERTSHGHELSISLVELEMLELGSETFRNRVAFRRCCYTGQRGTPCTPSGRTPRSYGIFVCKSQDRNEKTELRRGQKSFELLFSSVFIPVFHLHLSSSIFILIPGGRCFRSVGVADLTWST